MLRVQPSSLLKQLRQRRPEPRAGSHVWESSRRTRTRLLRSRRRSASVGAADDRQPHTAGPFTFGTSLRVGGRTSGAPGAFSLTSVYTRSEADVERVRTYSREIAAQLPHLKGFMGWVGVTIADRMMTITAWETPDDPRQLTTERHHAETMRAFFGSDLTAGGWTSVWVPQRVNARWRRCAVCGLIASDAGSETRCDCGAPVGEAPSYW